MQVRDGAVWSRPGTIEHRTLHGIDVWHAVLRARPSTRVSDRGVLTITIATAAIRFIPVATYEASFCSAEGCEESVSDVDGQDGLCANCAYAVESAGVESNAASTVTGPAADS